MGKRLLICLLYFALCFSMLFGSFLPVMAAGTRAVSVPSISAPFTTHPCVFMVEDTYQISFATDSTGIAWVEIGGQKYNDSTSGLMNWNSKYHKITVPQAALNNAQSYKICFRKITERLAYDTVPGNTASRTYPFEPAGENPVFLCLSDQHGDIDNAKTVASYQDYDIYVSGGDYAAKLVSDSDIKLLLDQTGAITKGVKPVIYSRGNHEPRGAYSHDLQRVAGYSEETGFYFTVSMPGIYGIVLDAGEDKSDSHEACVDSVDFEAYRAKQTKWLQELLASREWEKYPIRMAFCHIPAPFYNAENFQAVYKDWTALLNQMGISLLISGHSHNNVVYAPSNTRYKYPANFTTIVVSDRENGDYVYSGTYVSIKNQKFELKTITNTLAVKATKTAPILTGPITTADHETVEVTTPATYKTSSSTASVPSLNSTFTRHPTVFAVDDNYEIVFSTNTTGMAWVEVGGVKYRDSTAGMMDWSSKYHKVTVPRVALDVAKNYKICFQSMTERAAYYPTHGDTVSLTYPFKPIANKENPTFLCLSDCRNLNTEAGNVAKYQDFDVLYIGGDYVKTGNSEAMVTSLLDICSGATSGTKPVIYTRGNREVRGANAYLLEQIAPSESYYEVKLPNIYAIVLDSGEDKVDSDSTYGDTIRYEEYRKEQTQWLKELLASGEWKNYPTRVAFCHFPFTTTGTAAFKKDFAEWTELLDQMGISLLISGHSLVQKVYKPTDSAHVSDPSFSVLVVSDVENSTATFSGSYVTFATDKFTIKNVSSDKKLLSTTTATNLTAKSFWANSDDYLLFDFNNDSVAHKRYASPVYGGLNYDVAWESEPYTTATTVKDGVLSFSPIADTTQTVLGAFSRTVGSQSGQWDYYPLHYMPNANDYCRVRLKIEGAVSTATNGQSKLQLYLDCPNDIDSSADTTKYYHRFDKSFDLNGKVDKGYFTIEFPLSAAVYQQMNWVRLVHLRIADIKSATGKTAKVSVDYIYVGPKANFPQQSDRLFFDFTDTPEDHTRYNNLSYNYTNYDDPSTWTAYNGTPVISVGDGALNFDIPTNATSTSYSARSMTYYPRTLHHIPGKEDYVELRMKIDNAVSTDSGGLINFSIALDRPNNITNASGVTKAWTNIPIPFNLNDVGNKGYFVLTKKLTDAEYLASDWINVVHPNFQNIKAASGKQARISIDYIYIGPADGLPSRQHSISFCKEDGTVLETTSVSSGGTAVYSGAEPQKNYDENYHYNFTGWKNANGESVTLTNITGSMTVYASFTAIAHGYQYEIAEDSHIACCACGYAKNEAHAWDDGTVTKVASCIESGSILYQCVCSASRTEIVESGGHKEVIDEAVEATCTSTGLTQGTHCEACGTTLIAQDVVPASNHAKTTTTATNATCTETGSITVVCDDCGEILIEESVAALGHNYKTIPVAPTCTESGFTICLCNLCGYSYFTAPIAPTGHVNTTTITVDATCTEEGSVIMTCDDCGETVRTETVAALGHDYVNGICVCGAVEVTGPIVDHNISFGSQLVLASDLTMTFRMKPEQLTNYDLSTMYVVVERDIYGTDGTMTVDTQILTEYTTGNRLIFTYSGIAAAQMNDEIRAVLHIQDKNGKEYVSDVFVTSVTSYLDLLIASSTNNAKLMTLIMDMLNYGTAAQMYFKRHADAPANMAYESFITYADCASVDLNKALENLKSTSSNEGATGTMSIGLDLGTRIGIQYKVALPEGVNAADAVLVIKDANGNQLEGIDLSTGTMDSKGRYVVNFYGLASRQMRDVVTATAYVNGKPVTATYTYNISTYAYEVATTQGMPENLIALTRLMVIYGDSADAYFTK